MNEDLKQFSEDQLKAEITQLSPLTTVKNQRTGAVEVAPGAGAVLLRIGAARKLLNDIEANRKAEEKHKADTEARKRDEEEEANRQYNYRKFGHLHRF
jgi:hypothetical protein